MTVDVSSQAAIATLTLTNQQLKEDSTLTLLTKLAPLGQLTIKTPKKGSLSLALHNGSNPTVLTERNAIVRSLCGMGLHYALDSHPYYLLGGHGSKSNACADSAVALSSIASWMSFVDTNLPLTGDDLGPKIESVVNQFQEYFASHAFLAPTALPSLADIDLYFRLMATLSQLPNSLLIGSPVTRYMVAVDARLKQMAQLKQITFLFPRFSVVLPDPVPKFYYGDEMDLDSMFQGKALNVAVAKPAAKSAAAAAGGGAAAAADTKAAAEKKELTPEQIAAAEKRKAKQEQKAKQKANKPKQKATPPPAAELDISALELKVGQITKAWPHPDSDKLWCEEINVGEAEPRQILSGLRAFYEQSDMDQARVVVLCNLKEKKLGGIPSHGMVLCASNADHTAVEFVIPPANAKIGERVEFASVETVEAKPQNQVAKKKLLEKLVPALLMTNEDGVMVWKGHVSQTSDGPCVAAKGMKNAQVS